MLDAQKLKQYAGKTAEDFLEGQQGADDLFFAYLAHLLTKQKKSAQQILSKLIDEYPLSRVSNAVTDLFGNKNIDPNIHLAFGNMLRGICPVLGSPDASIKNEPQDYQFAYVIGTSNARGFGSSPYFFSIFSYIGAESYLLLDEKFENALERSKLTVERFANEKPVLVIIGGEPRLWLENRFPIRGREFGDLDERDYKEMEVAARKYKEFGLELQKSAKGPLYFLVPLPTLNEETNILTRHMIKNLYREFADTDLGIIDPFEEFIDEKTGLMDEKLQIVKDESELHFNHDGLLTIIQKFVDQDLLPEEALNDDLYQWSNQISVRLNKNHEVRIWNDPAKSLKSGMTAATMMLDQLIQYVLGHYIRNIPEQLIVLNAKQGFIPFNLPIGFAERIFSVSSTKEDIESAKRLYSFAGRPDIEVCDIGNLHHQIDSNKATDLLVCIYAEDDFMALEQQIKNIVERIKPKSVIVYTPQNHPDFELNNDQYKRQLALNFERRHIAENWQKCKMSHYRLHDNA